MRRNALVAAAALCLSLLAIPASAQDKPVDDRALRDQGRPSLGITAGTLGVGPEIGYRAARTIGVRANATFLSISHSVKANDVRYDGKVNLKSGGIMLDVYPFGGGFRLSGGARINGSNAWLRATPQNATTIGGYAFMPAQIGTISGRAELKQFAPQFMLGYGGGLHRGLSFNVEGGVLLQGAMRVRDFAANGTLANDPRFRVELEKERLDIQNKVNDYKLYPILQIGLKYRL